MNFKINFPTCLDPPRGSVDFVPPPIPSCSYHVAPCECLLGLSALSLPASLFEDPLVVSPTLPCRTVGPPFQGYEYVLPDWLCMLSVIGVKTCCGNPVRFRSPPHIFGHTFSEPWFFPLRRRAAHIPFRYFFFIFCPNFAATLAFGSKGLRSFMESGHRPPPGYAGPPLAPAVQ